VIDLMSYVNPKFLHYAGQISQPGSGWILRTISAKARDARHPFPPRTNPNGLLQTAQTAPCMRV